MAIGREAEAAIARQNEADAIQPARRVLRHRRHRWILSALAIFLGAGTFLVGQLAFGKGGLAILILGAGYFACLIFYLMPYLAWRDNRRR